MDEVRDTEIYAETYGKLNAETYGKLNAEDFTCYDCAEKSTCLYAFDLYNRNGDCLIMK